MAVTAKMAWHYSQQKVFMTPSQHPQPTQNPLLRLISGHYGLALTYWTLFFLASALFFVGASFAVAERDWQTYLAMLGALLVWTFLLLIGVKRGFRGEDPGKALGRIAMLFLLLDMTNALATLSFY